MKKNKKKEKKTSELNQKLEDKFNEAENRVLTLPHITRSVEIFAKLFIVFFAIASLVIVGVCSYTTTKVTNRTVEQVVSDDLVVEFIARINNELPETIKEDIIGRTGFSTLYVFSEIIIPSLFIIAAFVLVVIFCMKILDFIKGLDSDEKLFTEAKLEELGKTRIILAAIGILFFLWLGFEWFFFYLMIELELEIILYLLRYGVKHTHKK